LAHDTTTRHSRSISRMDDLKELIRVQFANIRREVRNVDVKSKEALRDLAEHDDRIHDLETRVALLEQRNEGSDNRTDKQFWFKAAAAIATGLATAAVYLWEKFK
jgi:hypothetical protein